jgi:hypothetical protein
LRKAYCSSCLKMALKAWRQQQRLAMHAPCMLDRQWLCREYQQESPSATEPRCSSAGEAGWSARCRSLSANLGGRSPTWAVMLQQYAAEQANQHACGWHAARTHARHSFDRGQLAQAGNDRLDIHLQGRHKEWVRPRHRRRWPAADGSPTRLLSTSARIRSTP